ncbi:hypothetical protein Pan258_22200 [Symmachiella dynata]|uniref:hypothetical protein n=1 Tax=Symmachiella dynata TaxID=2527995 RepID=UPI00118B4CEC|nr:hypothetical protein [Symmachiella dynata]QDT48180.1 hypothetical protein Pan258_22200 [Symmachiella dynata]
MSESWLRLPIYLDGKERFAANPSGDLTPIDAYERMDFVFNSIESCFADGRFMDVEIFNLLDGLGDRIRQQDVPGFVEISVLADRISSLYGLEPSAISDSGWVRQSDSGEYQIWIDKKKIIAAANEYLLGRKKEIMDQVTKWRNLRE